MKNYTKHKNNVEINAKNGAGLPSRACSLARADGAGAPYLTITNKSTSTPVKFRVFLNEIDDFLALSARYINSLRSWVFDHSSGGL